MTGRAPNYDIPMSGTLKTLEWNIGQDEDGKVTGFIGVPHEGEILATDDRSERGAVLSWGDPPLTGWTDDDLADAIIMACRFALKEYVARDLFEQMHAALVEARERLGGYNIEDDTTPGRQARMEVDDYESDAE